MRRALRKAVAYVAAVEAPDLLLLPLTALGAAPAPFPHQSAKGWRCSLRSALRVRHVVVMGALLVLVVLAVPLPAQLTRRWSKASTRTSASPFFGPLSSFAVPSPFPQTLTLAHLVRSPSTTSSAPPMEDAAPEEAEAALSVNWQSRLAPVRVAVVQGMAGVLINPMVLSGAANMPPLFAALPCIAAASRVSVNSTMAFPHAQCVRGQLLMGNGSSVVLSTHQAPSGRLVRETVRPAALSPMQMERMDDDGIKVSALSAYSALCPEGVNPSSRTWTKGDMRRNGSLMQASGPCSMDVPAELIFDVVSPVLLRYWLGPLVMGAAYAFSVQLFNGSHITEPVYSRRVAQQPQLELYQKEQRRLSSFLTHLALHNPLSLSSGGSDAPPTRRLAPFELAQPGHDSALCPAVFHRKVAEYRAWHARQVLRLLEVKDNPLALRALLTTDPHPVRLLVSRVNARSGVSDRTNGLLSVYLIALLSQRVLLMDDDWADILLSMQPSLHLPRSLIAPYLNHSLVHDLQTSIPVSLKALPTTELDRQFPSPITYITNIRGMQVRLLTSELYGPTMRSWGLTEDLVTGCVYHSLWVLRADGLMGQRGYEGAISHLLEPGNVGVGIQVRSWDDGAFDDVSTEDGRRHVRDRAPRDASPSVVLSRDGTQGFFHCAHDISDAVREQSAARGSSRANPIWLLVADDDQLREAAIAKWGLAAPQAGGASSGLLTLRMPSLLGHSSLAEESSRPLFQQHALVEQFLYSLCDWHILSRWSGFGRLPAALALKRRRVFALSPVPEEKQAMSCLDSRRHGMSIADIGSEGSLL